MYKEHTVLMLELFLIKIIGISKQHGASQEYIQGQLNEARHQLEVSGKKLHWSNKHGF